MRKRWLIALVVVGGLCLLGLVAFVATFRSFRIPSGSMEPTVMVGDHLFANRWAFRWRDPRRGELAVFEFPQDPSRLFIDRVVALPGDTIEIRGNQVFIDGKPLAEPYAVLNLDDRIAKRHNFGPLHITAGQFFVMGDNRDNSYDSRFYGPVPRASFRYGGPIVVYWSPDRRRIGKVLR